MDRRYYHWKNNIPFLYDTFLNNNSVWPSLVAAWGPGNPALGDPYFSSQCLYYAARTDATWHPGAGGAQQPRPGPC